MQNTDIGEGVYHVICRGNNKAPIFHAEEDFRAFLGVVAEVKKELAFDMYHYVLMTNHLHMVLRPHVPDALPMIMKSINQRYGRLHQRRYGNKGYLWQGRYKRYEIRNDGYLITCGVYIELNPVRAGMVSRPEWYPWSSYQFYAMGVPNPLITASPAYLGLGDSDEARRRAYLDLIRMWREHPVDKKRAKRFFKSSAPTLYP